MLYYLKLLGKLLFFYYMYWAIAIFVFTFFSQISLEYMTYKGVLLIYSFLLIMYAPSLVIYKLQKNGRDIKFFDINITYLYWGLFTASAIGLLMIYFTTDVIGHYAANELATLRGELLEGEVSVNRYYKILGNFVYPFAVAGPIYYFRKRQSWFIMALPIALGIALSFANGGKGNLLIIVILLIGSVCFFTLKRNCVLPPSLKKMGFFLVGLILVFFGVINATRTAEGNGGFDFLSTVDGVNKYFTNSIPAFCLWLNNNNNSFFGGEIQYFSLIRELGSIIGVHGVRTIDQQVVYIPQFFNVYTSYAEGIQAFGYIGALFYYICIGGVIGLLDSKMKNDNKVFLYSTFFLFIFYSLFADIFFYMIGSWMCLSFYFLFRINYK